MSQGQQALLNEEKIPAFMKTESMTGFRKIRLERLRVFQGGVTANE